MNFFHLVSSISAPVTKYVSSCSRNLWHHKLGHISNATLCYLVYISALGSVNCYDNSPCMGHHLAKKSDLHSLLVTLLLSPFTLFTGKFKVTCTMLCLVIGYSHNTCVPLWFIPSFWKLSRSSSPPLRVTMSHNIYGYLANHGIVPQLFSLNITCLNRTVL